MELGASHPGEIRPLAKLARPRVGVITNVRSVHLEGFGDLFGVARTKGELFEELPPDGVAVFNPAELGMSQIARRCGRASITFGARPGVHVRLESVEERAEGIAATINGVRFEVPLMSRRLAWNVCAGAAVGLAFGIDLPRAAEALRRFEAPSDRLSRRILGGLVMLYDAYNANPTSMRAALDAVRTQPAARRRVLVLGDMLELGPVSKRAHEDLGRAVAQAAPDLTVSVGRCVRATVGAMRERGVPAERIVSFEDTESAARSVPSLLADGDVVLLKASRGLKFEKIRDAIEARFAGAGAG